MTNKTYYDNNKEIWKKYYAKNKKKILEKSKKYYIENKESYQIRRKKRLANCEEDVRKKEIETSDRIRNEAYKFAPPTCKAHQVWEEDEIEFLRIYFKTMKVKELGKALGRSYTATANKKRKLGLYKKIIK